MAAPDDRLASDAAPGDRAAAKPTSATTTVVRAVVRPVKLVVTALAIVLALAFGIPWLISLVW